MLCGCQHQKEALPPRRGNRFESYWIGSPVAVPDVGGSFIACTLKDSAGRQKLVAYGYGGDGHYSYTHMPGMDEFVGPLIATSQCDLAVRTHAPHSSECIPCQTLQTSDVRCPVSPWRALEQSRQK